MRISGALLSLLLVLCVLSAGQLVARQSPNASCEVPFVATRFNRTSGAVELVEGLSASDFEVRFGDDRGAVESVSIDRGPKRVALILDVSKNVPADEWKLETRMAAKLLEHARPKDQFAIFLVGTDGSGSVLLPSSEARQRLKELGSNRPTASDSSEKIYDALLAAADRLNPSEFGDALFLFGHPEDSGSAANSQRVLEVVLKNRLRLYAISFFDPLMGKLPPGYDPNKPLPASLTFPDLEGLSEATGYFFSFHSVRALNLPGQIPLFERFLADLYAGIAEPYRLQITQPSIQGRIKLDISLKDLKSRGINRGDIHYPHSIYSCTSSVSPTN